MWIEFCKVRGYLYDQVESRMFAERKPEEMGFGYYCWKGASYSEKMQVPGRRPCRPFYKLRSIGPT